MKIGELKALARQLLLGRYGLVIGTALLRTLITGVCIAAAVFSLLFCTAFGFIRFVPELRSVQGMHLLSAADAWGGLQAGAAILFVAFLLLAAVLSYLLSLGQTKLYLKLCRRQPVGISDLFYAFQRGAYPLRCLCAVLLMILLSFLCGILAFLPMLACVFFAEGMPPEYYEYIYLAFFYVLLFFIVLPYSFAVYLLIDEPGLKVGEAMKRSRKLMKGQRLRFVWLAFFSFFFWNILLACTFYVAGLWIGPYMACTSVLFYLNAAGGLPQARMQASEETEAYAKAEAATASAETVKTDIIAETAITAETAVTTETDISTDTDIAEETDLAGETDTSIPKAQTAPENTSYEGE